MSVLLNGSGREKKLLNNRAYTQGEIIAIFIVSSLIVILSAVYWHQTSTEKQIAVR